MIDNRPISGTLVPSVRLTSRESVDERCWAFMKELRQHYRGRFCLPVDPWAEVYPLGKNSYAIYKESLDGMGDVWLYLINGPEKAMLIDTGFGLGNLKGLCSEITGEKELIVVNTHPHVDHALGNYQFDKVYCHEYAVPTLQGMNNAHARDYLFDGNGNGIFARIRPDDLIEYRDYEIIGVPDGYTFSLGKNYNIELIFTAGHASGHCMFLDKQTRRLYAGDDVISMRIGIGGPKAGDPYGKYATVKAYHEQMAKLAARMDEYDYIFPGHFVFGLENYVVEDLVKTAAAILANPNCYEFITHSITKNGPVTRMQKHVPGLGTLAYTEKALQK